MGTFIPVHGSAGLPIAAMCGVAPVTNRTIDAAVETWSAAVSGMTDYWSAAIAERRTPADVALDSLRWWQLMADRRPPQWASRQRIVRRSPLTRLRDFTPARPADVVPTLVLPPQAGHDSCIVDYSSAQSQMQTILAAGLERLYALDWIGVTQETKDATIDRLPGRGATPRCRRRAAAGRVNLVGDCQGGWLADHLRGAAPRARQHAHHRRRADRLPRRRRRHPRKRRRRSATTTCPSSAPWSDQGNGVLKGEFLLGGFIVIKPENEVGKQLQLLAHVRDAAPCRALPGLRGLVQAHPGHRRALLSVARRAPLPRQRAHRRDAAHRRRARSTSDASTAPSTSWPAPPTTSRRPSRSSPSPTPCPRPPSASRGARRRAATSGCSWAPRRCATTGRS